MRGPILSSPVSSGSKRPPLAWWSSRSCDTAAVCTPRNTWQNTTHDWSRDVDPDHLDAIRRAPAVFAPRGALHLTLEVLAYAADEAAGRGSGHATVTLY